MNGLLERIKRILLSIRLFSALVVQVALRNYQVGPADAVIDSCLHQKGLEFLWVFPRQSGKDEAVAQLVAFLLTLFQRTEAGLVHVYPTGQQLATGVQRLERRLDNLWTEGRWWQKSKPIRRGLGKAQCAFFSGHPAAKAEGATANLLLIINEAQDQDEATIERRFTPMRASTNATALYVGTVRTTSDYLWRVKQRLEKLEQADGVKRVFFVSPDQVGEENPHYAQFVAGQVRAKGRNHPSVRTELFNEPVDTQAGLFPERRRALMRGKHRRLRCPEESGQRLAVSGQPTGGEVYLALVDVGGQDEGATSAFAELTNPERDYTVCTMVRVVKAGYGDTRPTVGPTYEAVDVAAWQGTRHFQDAPGQPSLFNSLLAYLRMWEPTAVICDATGVGQGIADALTTGYKRPVFHFDFSGGRKARLGNDFLAVVETGRFQYFHDPEQFDYGSDEWFFFLQCEFCGYELAPGVPIERGLRWGVSPTAKVQIPGSGEMLLVHDDRLLSAALVAEADRLIREGELFISTGQAAVIRPEELGRVRPPQPPTGGSDQPSLRSQPVSGQRCGRWS